MRTFILVLILVSSLKKTAFLDAMNFFSIVRWVIQPQKKVFLAGKSWLAVTGHIRCQSSEVPTKEQPRIDVNTNVTPPKQSNLMEFFDTGEKLYETKVIHGKT